MEEGERQIKCFEEVEEMEGERKGRRKRYLSGKGLWQGRDQEWRRWK